LETTKDIWPLRNRRRFSNSNSLDKVNDVTGVFGMLQIDCVFNAKPFYRFLSLRWLTPLDYRKLSEAKKKWYLLLYFFVTAAFLIRFPSVPNI